jgi:hypothetical protein
VANAPAASRGKINNHTSVVTTGPPGSPSIPARNGFNGLFRALPGDEFVLSPSSADSRNVRTRSGRHASANLTPATGARTTRLRRPQKRRSSRTFLIAHRRPSIGEPALRPRPRASAAASTASRLNVRDDRERPSYRGGTAQRMVLIWGLEQCRTPATQWHDGQVTHGMHARSARRALFPLRIPRPSSAPIAIHTSWSECAGDVDSQIQRRWRTPALVPIADLSRTSRHVRKVPARSGIQHRTLPEFTSFQMLASEILWVRAAP